MATPTPLASPAVSMIPLVAHFIWIGASLPYTHLIAIRSAARLGGFEQVILHHTHDLSTCSVWPDIRREPKVATRRLHPNEMVAAVEARFLLGERFALLKQPAAIANVLRLLILEQQGGVYLDLDTVTLQSFQPLCAECRFFCGEERLVFPATVRGSKSPWVQAQALMRTAARDVLRRLPGGWRRFRGLERFYPKAANNAVLGAEAEHPFLTHLLSSMAALPEAEWKRRFRLGTHLLQRALETYAGADVTRLPPEVFFPLGPEISEHWFQTQHPPAPREMIQSSTISVHWYASVRTERYTEGLSREKIQQNAGSQAYAALALPFTD